MRNAWAEAVAAGSHLQSLLEAGPVEPKTAQRATAFLAELGQADKDRRMVTRIEELTLRGSTHTDVESWLWMDEEFAAAFRDYGINVETLEREEILRRIRESTIPEELAHAWDLWVRTSFYIFLQKHPRYSFDTVWPRVEMVFEAEDDPLRSQLRRFVFSADPKVEALAEIIAANDPETLPARTLVLLVASYSRVGYAAGWQEICRRGLQRFPDDLNLVGTCADAYAQVRDWRSAARYFTSAIALRPATGGLWRRLGHALHELGERQEAIEALQRAAEVQPDYAHIHLDLGRYLAEAGRLDEAAAALRRCYEVGTATARQNRPLPDWLQVCEAGMH